MWLVQAADPPSHCVFQVSHADVLISPEEKPTSGPEPPATVLASSKTIQALQTASTPAQVEDPWIHHDLWQATRPSRELSTGQIASMETRIEQAVIAQVKQAR